MCTMPPTQRVLMWPFLIRNAILYSVPSISKDVLGLGEGNVNRKEPRPTKRDPF